jgi:hypothetical protein
MRSSTAPAALDAPKALRNTTLTNRRLLTLRVAMTDVLTLETVSSPMPRLTRAFSITAVNCIKCTDMQHCAFELEYGDGSTIEGEVIQDKFTVGNMVVQNFLGSIDNINLKNWEPVRNLLLLLVLV